MASRRPINGLAVRQSEEAGAINWEVRHRGWAAQVRLTSFPDRRHGKVVFALVRAPRAAGQTAVARRLAAAAWREAYVSLPPARGGRIGDLHPDDAPVLVRRILSVELSAHDMADLTLRCAAVGEAPGPVEPRVAQVRAARTVAELDHAFEALLRALTWAGSRQPEADAQLRFGLCYATELRKRQDWLTDAVTRE